MVNDTIVIYDYPHSSYLELIVKDDTFKFVSEVYMYEDETSEVHYSLNKEETAKVLKIMSYGDFIEFCRREHLRGILEFFKTNNIDFTTQGF